MIPPLRRIIRNWRSNRAVRRCAATSHDALKHADQGLATLEKQGARFVLQIQAIAEPSKQDGPTLIHTRSILTDQSMLLRLHFQTEIGNLLTALLKKRSRADRFTVALFGRTMAGKSTIREAICGGDGSTIGKGGQRTTRDVREYAWNQLSIVDTPGFGTYEGEEDERLAFSVVDESDIIIFLLTSDSTQKEVSDQMAALSRIRKNVVFVLNVRCALTKPSQERIDFRRDPESFLQTAIDQHRDRIESLAREHANWMPQDIRLLALHAQAAHRAQLPECKSEAKWLYGASNIRRLLHLLEDELHQFGPERRIQTIIGGTERALVFTADHLKAVSEEILKQANLLEEKHLELKIALDDLTKRFPKRCHDAVMEHFSPIHSGLGSFLEENLKKKDFKQCWRSRIEELKTAEWGKNFTVEVAEEVSSKVAEFWRQLQYDAEFVHQQDVQGTDTADPRDWRKVVRRIGYGISVAAFAAILIASAGFVGSAAASAAAVTEVVGVAISLLSYLLPDVKGRKQKATADAREKLTVEISALSKQLEQDIAIWFTKEIENDLIIPLHRDIKCLCEAIRSLASSATELSASIELCRNELVSNYPDHFPRDSQPVNCSL